jgi:anti-sigma B factor antagonist
MRGGVSSEMLRLRCLACGLTLPYKGSTSDLCPRCLVSGKRAVALIPVSDAPASHATAGRLRLNTRVEGRRHTIFLSGEIDVSSAPFLEDAVAEQCSQQPEELSLDMAGVEFMDSSGLRAILHSKQRCEALDCRFEVSPAQRPVERTLEVTGVRSRLSTSRLGQRLKARPAEP